MENNLPLNAVAQDTPKTIMPPKNRSWNFILLGVLILAGFAYYRFINTRTP
ncbi:MAG: hypothetical protein ACI965_002419 [Paraglaciecola sp.]